MRDNGKILTALLLGAATGAVLGLLFAPSKGSELREKLRSNTDDLIGKLSDKINEGKDALVNLKDKASSKAQDFKSKAENQVDSFENKAKHTDSNY